MVRVLATSVVLLAVSACWTSVDPAPAVGSAWTSGDSDRPAVEVTFLDVGQGDATLIRTSGGRTALIDAGPGDPTAQLRELGVERLDLVIATHPHADHIGGMKAVLEGFPVGSYMDSGKPHTTRTYLDLLRALRNRPDIRYLEAVPRSLTLGSATLEVLPLPSAERQPDDRSGRTGLVPVHRVVGAHRCAGAYESPSGRRAEYVVPHGPRKPTIDPLNQLDSGTSPMDSR